MNGKPERGREPQDPPALDFAVSVPLATAQNQEGHTSWVMRTTSCSAGFSRILWDQGAWEGPHLAQIFGAFLIPRGCWHWRDRTGFMDQGLETL